MADLAAFLKTTKRRALQAGREKMGMAERTQDHEFETLRAQVVRSSENLNASGAQMQASLMATREWSGALLELSEEFEGLLDRPYDPIRVMKEKWTHCDRVLRRSMASVVVEQPLGRLRTLCAEDLPQIQEQIAARDGELRDMDAYRHKMQSQQDQERRQHFNDKYEGARGRYERDNVESKEAMRGFIDSKDTFVQQQAAWIIATNAEMLSQMAQQLEEACQAFPADEVAAARAAVRDLIGRGGPPAVDPAVVAREQERAAAAPVRVVGQALGRFKQTVATAAAAQRANDSAVSAPPQVGGFAAASAGSAAPPAAPSVPVTPGAPAGGGEIAVAMYDYAAEEEGELSFSAGDRITVLRKDPSGWWEGECKGKRGIYPGNYSELQ